MDPFTDMLLAYAQGTISILDLYSWYSEWLKMADPSLICRAAEMGTQLCANATEMLIRLTW